jgi:hypothetical protein
MLFKHLLQVEVFKILPRFMGMIVDGVWIGKWIYLPLIHTIRNYNNYSAIANLYTLQMTTAPAKPFRVYCFFNSRSLATISNSGYPAAFRAQVLFSQPSVPSIDSEILTANYNSGVRVGVRVRVRITLRLAVYRQSLRLGASPLEIHDQRSFFFQLSPCGNSPHVTSSLTRRLGCLL